MSFSGIAVKQTVSWAEQTTTPPAAAPSENENVVVG